jgi:Methyltransferase domain
MADADCQMSFGERAALLGVLGALRPRIAVETGTYEGGSLRFLAAHCAQVHTFDLCDLVHGRDSFENVAFHIGDSRVLLPELLRDLQERAETVDFALIDGDHSSEGVRRDLASLLDSAVADSAVILLHDTMNPEVRAGIELAGLAARANVVYYELDFVAGYEFVGGHFDGQTWGGLGLVVTGDRRNSGYGPSPAQTLYRESFEVMRERRSLDAQLVEARSDLDHVQRELQAARHWLNAIESSVSWRMTEPLRAVRRRLSSSGSRKPAR